jgi:hypothetical protein
MRSTLFILALIVSAIVYIAMTAPETVTPEAQVMIVPTPLTYNQPSADMYKTYAEGNLANAEAGATSISSKSDAALDYVMVMALAVVTVMGVVIFVKIWKVL